VICAHFVLILAENVCCVAMCVRNLNKTLLLHLVFVTFVFVNVPFASSKNTDAVLVMVQQWA